LQLVKDHFGEEAEKIGFYYEDLVSGEVVQLQAEQHISHGKRFQEDCAYCTHGAEFTLGLQQVYPMWWSTSAQ
jgi:biotin synthase-like enzyme